MPIPTEVVGSLPRPVELQKAFKDYAGDKITKEDLVRVQDKAAQDSMQRMKATGETYITDGEQRASSFATYPILDTLTPQKNGLADCLESGGQYFAIFDDGHHRQLPRLKNDFKGPFSYKNYAWQNLTLSSAMNEDNHPMKQAVIAPSMLYLLYPLTDTLPNYPREEFVNDLTNECEKDIRGCFQAGAKRVSIDFTEGRLACRNDPKNPWTGAKLLETFVSLINRVLARFTPAERTNIGVHTCPGGDCDSVHSLDVPYASLLPSLFHINAGYFLIQLSSEAPSAKPAIYQQIGQQIRADAEGVKQVAFVGVTNPLSPVVETPEEVRDALVEAGRWIPVDQLGATDDCGFSPFSLDEKPKHAGGPDFARDVAFEKIAARVKGARLASEKLGV
ncbi:hypothetical protein EIP91_002133 [Steccherinum ochraceum]|uniref:Cobalamin-independent methionine synthase MetE C-terminal/archaeal domain-containing protein n=1 Tax=Steccherinum ochraceum TaxID=92696 RepID=A0A4R0RCV8_9APHY|nr:hypothetical protein EIP91_002133 [Steccherinum ochraceum]